MKSNSIDKPNWLPDIVSVDGVWEEVINRLYTVFNSDFKHTARIFDQRQVWWDRRILDKNGYEEGFWHLITKLDRNKGTRLFDSRRAERISWCGPTISNSKDKAVKSWDYEESSRKVRTYIWLENWDYVIILEKKRIHKYEVAFLITAYYVDGPSGRRNLNKKYRNRIT